MVKCLRALVAGATALLILAGPAAAERRAIVTPDADYFGRDLRTLKDVPVEDCENACVADGECKAFTYNTKARWCFLKADFGDLRPFVGAVSGRIVEGEVPSTELQALRRAELDFIASDTLAYADTFLKQVLAGTATGTVDEAVRTAAEQAMAGNAYYANETLKNALRLAPERFDLWALFAETTLGAGSDTWSERSRLADEAVYGSILAYDRAASDADRARTLAMLSRAFAKQEAWNRAIKAARRSLEIAEDATVSQELDTLISQHGFRVADNRVETTSETPRICAVFSEPIAADRPNITDFVAIEGGDGLAIEAESGQVCATGVEFGRRYAMTLRKGLPAADGVESLYKTVSLDFYIRDRDPMVHFVGKAYVLPRHAEATIPVVSVNVDVIEAEVVRIGDRGLVQSIQDGSFLQQMSDWQAESVISQAGEGVWTGTVEVARETNRDVTTAIPVGEVVKDLEPGVYAMVARPKNDKEDWGARATQWFIVTDLGLTTLSGNDGLHAMVRSLGTAGAVEGATLTLVARNNEVLGTVTTDAEGYARFDAGLARGTLGNAPALLTARTAAGDYAFIDLTRPAFDLTDRGVTGRLAPQPVDVFTTTERGVYRPGEWVHVTTLMRDAAANAAPDLPMTMVVSRPDGAEALRRLVADKGAGGRDSSFALPEGAMRGTWRLQVFTDPEAPALAETSFLVEDFLPERIDFAFSAGEEPLKPGSTKDVEITARWLYGAPAANLAIEGEVYVTRAEGVASAPGYTFGLEGEEFTPVSEPVSAPPTDADGHAVVTLTTPDVSGVTAPLEAAVHVRVLDTNGRPVERRTTLPVAGDKARIGVDPLFEDSVREGDRAAWNVAVFDADGKRVAAGGLTWTLYRVETQYQWYMESGSWDYRPLKTTRRAATGTVDVVADAPAKVEGPVEWGEYRLEVRDPADGLIPVSTSFYAGWYVAPSADPAPDMLEVSLDKPAYAVGDTLTARILPRFPGTALVTVVDDRLIDMKVVEVGADGATVSLPVTPDWGPGAYVTAELIRPMDLPAKRMPQRAIGIAHAAVDPGDRLLQVGIAAPEETRPRGPLPIEVTLANARPGEDAFVTIAAVDAGILNLTGFAPPAPEDWYFAQRRLGMEIRDVYGQLIDTTIGARGLVRSGGDGSGISRLIGPPPTEKLVAFYQGVTRVDADGKVRASFDLPDFNGTVRVMAIAWSRTGVGHAARDVLVRDPVVVQAALPNFLAPDDRSRLRLDITHVQGPSGDFRLAVTAAGSLVEVGAGFAERRLSLGDKASAMVEVPLVARGVGDETLTVALTAPDGSVLTKTLTVPVRANEPPTVRVSDVSLAARSGRLDVDGDLLSDFVPGTGMATVTVGAVGGIDLPGLVRSLDRYPYGCAEQITSRALPLVYLDEVVLAAGLAGEQPVRERVHKAVEDVLTKQASNGSFGLWGPDYESADIWLNAYVTDFLTRAKEKGYDVPPVPLELAVTNLKNKLAYAQDFSEGGEGIAYALYVLARNGRATIGDLRYFAETRLDAFGTPLAKAQLGAALALYGDQQTADRVFRTALDRLRGLNDRVVWRADYGSDLRDSAAILTLASETRTGSVDLDILGQTVRDLSRNRVHLSTQEQSWMLLAAHSLLTEGRKPQLEVNGTVHDTVYVGRLAAEDLARPVSIVNRAGFDADGRVTLSGVPITPEPAGGEGYRLERRYFDLEGRDVDPSRLALGQRVVVVLTVTKLPSAASDARLMINDPLPAGLVIDNPNLLTGADAGALEWLSLLDAVDSTEFRADRFLAAVTTGADVFSVGYMARTVAPGDYARPAATVEDMYRPYMRARTDSGRMLVETAGP